VCLTSPRHSLSQATVTDQLSVGDGKGHCFFGVLARGIGSLSGQGVIAVILHQRVIGHGVGGHSGRADQNTVEEKLNLYYTLVINGGSTEGKCSLIPNFR